MLLIPLAIIAIRFIPQYGALALMGVFILNGGVHEITKRKIQRDLDTVNYSVSMVFALNRIRRLHDPVMDRVLKDDYVHLEKLRSVLRIGGVSVAAGGSDAGDIVSTLLLLDLIAYELLKNKLGRCYKDVFAIRFSMLLFSQIAQLYTSNCAKEHY